MVSGLQMAGNVNEHHARWGNAKSTPDLGDMRRIGFYLAQRDDFAYFERLRPALCHSPEERLMLAVLENAIWTMKYHRLLKRPAIQKQVQEDEKWLDSEEEHYVFSFRVIAEKLGFNPDWLRKGIKEFCRRKDLGGIKKTIYRERI